MLNKIQIHNFQSHKDTEIEFSPGVNIIKGPSDCGKTAVLRALNLLVNNKPSGDAYCSSWGGKTSVKGTFDDCEVTNARTSSSNEYVLNESVFRALGGKVPEEIQKAINMDDINIQRQMDAPFLLSETSGEVAKVLNKIANLDIIDVAMQNINKEVRSANANMAMVEGKITEYEQKMNKFKGLDDIKALLSFMKVKMTQVDKVKTTVATVKDALLKYTNVQDALLPIQDRIAILEKRIARNESIAEIEAKYLAVKEKRWSLNISIDKLEEVEKKVTEYQKRISLLKTKIASLEKRAEVEVLLQVSKDKYKIINDTFQKYFKTKEAIDLLQLRIKEKREDIKEKMGDVCPLCEQKIGE